LLDRRRVAIVVAGHGAEAVGDHGGRVDRGDGPPEQVVVLGVQGRRQRIGADEVDHRHQPRCLEQVRTGTGEVSASASG
jgi:hypothetical protein